MIDIRKKRGFTLVEMIAALTISVMILGAIDIFALAMRRQVVTRANYLYPRTSLSSVYGDLTDDVTRSHRIFLYQGRLLLNGALWQGGAVALSSAVTSDMTPTEFLSAAALTNESADGAFTICMLDGRGGAVIWLVERHAGPSALRYRVSWWRGGGRGAGSAEFTSNGFTTSIPDQALPSFVDAGTHWIINLPNPAFTYRDYLLGGTPRQPVIYAPKRQ